MTPPPTRDDVAGRGSAVVVVVAGLFVAGVFLLTYLVHRFPVPLGWDTAGYAWRTSLARTNGIASLPASIPLPGPPHPGRPAFVTVAAVAGPLFGATPFRIAEVVPAVAAAATGLASGVLVSSMLRRPAWQLAVVAVGVGASVFVVHEINVEGYQDATLAMSVTVAAFTPLLLAVRERRAFVPAVVLLGCAGLMHWPFFSFTATVVVLTAAVFAPSSFRAWRSHREGLLSTATSRLLGAAAGGAAVASATVAGLMTAPLPGAKLDETQFVGKTLRDIRSFGLPVLLPAAAGGALAVAAEEPPGQETGGGADDGAGARRRSFLALMLAWCEVAVLFFAGAWVLGKPLPTHRVLSATLALPILGLVGVLWVAGRASRASRALGVAVVAVALAVSVTAAAWQWLSFRPVIDPAVVTQAATAEGMLAAYSIPLSRPVVFVVDTRANGLWSKVWLTAHSIRTALPDRVESTRFFVGRVEDLLAGRSTRDPVEPTPGLPPLPPSTHDIVSAVYFRDVRPVLARHPVVLTLRAADTGFDAAVRGHVATEVAPGVAAVEGLDARPLPLVPAAAPSPTGRLALIALAVGLLAVVWVIGYGWGSAMLSRWLRPFELLAIAPAVGIAALVLGGIVLNVVGIPFSRSGSLLIVAVLVGGGSLARAVTRRRERAAALRCRSSSSGASPP